MSKERVDILCVEQGLFESREKAKRAIMAGIIHDDHQILDKPGIKIERQTKLSIKGEQFRYVSRGGLKLEKAIHYFNIYLKNRIMLDIGSSTDHFSCFIDSTKYSRNSLLHLCIFSAFLDFFYFPHTLFVPYQ